MVIEEHISLLEGILAKWKEVIGNDFPGYKNHVYHMIHFRGYPYKCGDFYEFKICN